MRQAEGLLCDLPGRGLQVPGSVQVPAGGQGCLQVPVRRGVQVRRSLQVPQLHPLQAEGVLHLLPGRRLQV